MHEMQILMANDAQPGNWNLNLITPFQSLLQNGQRSDQKGQQTDIYNRLELACVAHSKFIGCLQTCLNDTARSIVEIGQTNWAFLCDSLKHNSEFRRTILPCWIKHGETISIQCHFHALMLQNSVIDLLRTGWNGLSSSLEEICRTLALYDKCYIGQSDKMCGKDGWEFILKLNTKNSRAIFKLITEHGDAKNLPPMCEQWRYPEEYEDWHVRKIAYAHRSGSMGKLPSIFIVLLGWLFLC